SRGWLPRGRARARACSQTWFLKRVDCAAGSPLRLVDAKRAEVVAEVYRCGRCRSKPDARDSRPTSTSTSRQAALVAGKEALVAAAFVDVPIERIYQIRQVNKFSRLVATCGK